MIVLKTKCLFLIFALFFLIINFSSSSYAQWTKVGEDTLGSNYYVDFDRIRFHGGYVYWWDMSDYLKPVNNVMSTKSYNQGDCNRFRFKMLSASVSAEPMSSAGAFYYGIKVSPDWVYPPPNDINEIILNLVCKK